MAQQKPTPKEVVSRIQRAIDSGIDHVQGEATPEQRAAAFVAYFSGALKNIVSEEFGDKLFNLVLSRSTETTGAA
ncbi:hypothetical protein [Noviherbaspirillum autotrophicum]|uniref:Uncharacterized protein n=1 Tax=Noviherbaspirillum autotrophicum TaxID=709839 RepID=A0A0C2BVK4_9BURK|nr:hypothetical protein [Noviherbaspirillum autotrophicum]KIF80791.1 hypothetical protein TSA66_08100 [Noviherbaspirillum autotrophicum]KIF80829.1 hypothetical protein TSA66_08345 [Noviherbaspirillum autotrophicum]KIF84054.1 hypothetical protein TSA66_01035 [Noviherbaspirillum autotrophicum]